MKVTFGTAVLLATLVPAFGSPVPELRGGAFGALGVFKRNNNGPSKTPVHPTPTPKHPETPKKEHPQTPKKEHPQTPKKEHPKPPAKHPAPAPAQKHPVYQAPKEHPKQPEHPKGGNNGGNNNGGNNGGKRYEFEGVAGRPSYFTSFYTVYATPDQVISTATQQPVAGLPGGSGTYYFGLNSQEQVICAKIDLFGFPNPVNYSSPARTATHIHQAPRGRAGPPRIAFQNPQYGPNGLQSLTCQSAPFVTGINAANTTTDTGSASGFTLSQIEANSTAFFADVHIGAYLQGAVRGQFP